MGETFLVLTWNDIAELSLELAEKVIDSGYRPDVAVAVLRGGYIVAKLLCDYLGVDSIATVEVKFYKGVGEKAERPVVITPITHDLRGKKVLIVDDVSDSGRTLQVVIDLARLHGAKEVRSATLYLKPWSITIPDYYVRETKSWIVFPWEIGEVLKELAKKFGGYENAVNMLKLEEYYNKKFIERVISIAKKL
ncbi:MAG: phosphoribosyltransferase [Ignisphaera sp.]|nr:phosphoribosyltransferase [Ignisphaera sp.]